MELEGKKQAFLASLILLVIHLCPSCSELKRVNKNTSLNADEVHVGVIDMHSWSGKISNTCISMAISDFYALNTHYKTRLVLHSRDSEGDPFRALNTGNIIFLLEKFISDFYIFNTHYKTKQAVHSKKFEGDPLLALTIK